MNFPHHQIQISFNDSIMKNIYKLSFLFFILVLFSFHFSLGQKREYDSAGNKVSSRMVDELIAGYPFNGNANDISGNGNGGIINGQTLTADRFGRPDRAFQFSSTNGGIQTTFVDQPDAISLWFQTTSSAGTLTDWGSGTEGVYGFVINVLSTGIELVYNSGNGIENGNTFLFAPRTGLTDGNWHHLVIDIDEFNGVFTFYIDKTIIATEPISGNGILWGGINSLGLEIGPNITGRIDDLFFFFGNIFQSEVDELYHSLGWAVPPNSLVLNFDFTDAIVEDLSGFGYNPTLIQADAVTDRFGLDFNAVGFNGIDQRIETSGVPVYDNISISAWFRTSADFSSGFRSFVDLSGISALSIGPNNFLEGTLRFGETDFLVLNSNSLVNDGLWHHTVITFDGTTAKLYLDDILVDSREINGPLYKTSIATFLDLGFIFNDANAVFFTGEVDDINYFNYGISASEVNTLFSENDWSSTSPIASYFFSGNSNDASGNNLNGSVVGATLSQDRFGALDNSYSFDGSSYISVPDDPLFSLGQSTDLAISGWFNTTASNGFLFDKSNGSTGYFAAFPNDGSNEILFFAIQDGVGSSQVRSSAGFNDGKWHHFAMQMDRNGGMQIYIDGLLDRENANALSDGFNPDTSEDFLFGVAGGVNNQGLNNHFIGHLDDIQVYKRLLSDFEILDLYEEGVWPLLEQVQLEMNLSGTYSELNPVLIGTETDYVNVFDFFDDTFTYILNEARNRPYGDVDTDGIIDLLGTPISPSNGMNVVKLRDNTREYLVSPITSLGFIGSARTGDDTGWLDPDTDMEYKGAGVFELNNIELFDGEWKIRVNDIWDLANWGLNPNIEGELLYFGTNIPITAGVYNISVDIINETYSVTAVEPTTQPTNFVVNNIGPNSVDFSFTSSENVSGFLVLRSEAQFPTNIPEDFTKYQYGDQINGEVVIYSGADTNVIDENLNPNTQYFYAVFAYNGADGSINYLTTNPLNGNITTTELPNLATVPQAQPTAFEIISKSENSSELRFSKSDATGYLVVRSENNNSFFTPADGIAYNTNDSFGDAIVSYVGEDNFWSESSLSSLTNYYFTIYGFNGVGNEINYLQDNPLVGQLLTLTEAPTSQADNFRVLDQTFSSFRIVFNTNFTEVDGYIVVRKEGGTPPNAVPVGGISYGLGEIGSGEEVVAFGAISEFEETNLNIGDTFSYAIYSFNGENDFINYNLSNPLTGTASTLVDNTGPIIQNLQFNDEVGLGDPLNISVRVVDEESSIDEVQIQYIIPGTNNFDNPTTDDMFLSGNEYTYEISNLTEAGLEFKIFTRNVLGLEELSNTQSVKIVYSGDGLQIPFNSFGSEQSNYRITSIPLTLSNNTVNDVFGKELGNYGDKSIWKMYRYSNDVTSELSGSSSLIPGRGYWLIVNKSEASFFSGEGKNVDANVDQPYEIVLSPGWNQIGNPYTYDVSWSDVQALNDIDVELKLFNGSFINGNILPAFSGGFVNWQNSSDFTLRIPTTSLSSSQNRILKNDAMQGWELNLTLEKDGVINELTGVGMHADSNDDLDSKDQFNLPRFLNFIDLEHKLKFNGYNVAKDFAAMHNEYVWTFDIVSNLGIEGMEISWQTLNNSRFDKSNELMLWDPSSGNLIDMKKTNHFQLRNSDGKKMRIIYGSKNYVNSLIEVNKLKISDPYPNPSSGLLNIQYQIPKDQIDSEIVFELFDLKGRLINRNKIKPNNAAHGLLEWNIKETSEKNLSGVYLLRISNDRNSVNKKILLK